MSSIIQIDLPNSVKTAQESLDFFANFGINSGMKTIADPQLNNAETKTKALVDAMIATVEAQIGDMLENGISNMYSAMGLNEQTINMARTVISLSKKATGLLSSGIMKGLIALNSFNVQALPMSALVAGLKIISSVCDLFYKKYLEAYQVYIDLIVEFVVNPGQVIEVIKDMLWQIVEKIYEMIDEQVFLYTGYHIVEIRYLCQKGYNYYKQWKEAKKSQHRAGGDASVEVSVTVDPKIMETELKEWLKNQSDALYNSFMLLQIMDAINSIKETVSALTDVNLETLADNINSLDDLIILLDELGLGDESTAVDLSIIPSLNINSIASSMNSMKGNLTGIANDAILTTAAAVNSGVNVSGNVTANKTYEIQTDHKTKTIFFSIYIDPTTPKYSQEIYKILNDTKNEQGKKMFNLSECKMIQTSINNLYETNKETGKGHTEIKVDKFTIDVTLDVSAGGAGQISQQSFSYGNQNIQKRQEEIEVSELEKLQKQQDDYFKNFKISIDFVKEDDWTGEDETETRRNTIALVHMCYSLLKSIFPVLKNIAILINNYKINKAYAKQKSHDNIFALFKECMDKLGLNKSININQKNTSDNNFPAYLYTVRTYSFYQYLCDRRIITDNTRTTFGMSIDQVLDANIWLAAHDTKSEPIPTDKTITLYVDYDSISEEKKCIDEQRRMLANTISAELIDTFVKDCSKFSNGSFNNLRNVEITDGYVFYSDKNLPRTPSQIIQASIACNKRR